MPTLGKLTKHKIEIKNHTIFRINNRVYPGEKNRRCRRILWRYETMANSNNSNRVEVPEAKEALNRFKQEVASELGVPLKEGYNGDLTSRQAGSIGGEMVRKMIRSQEEKMSSGQ
jgi:hypothetical protein